MARIGPAVNAQGDGLSLETGKNFLLHFCGQALHFFWEFVCIEAGWNPGPKLCPENRVIDQLKAESFCCPEDTAKLPGR